MCIRDSYRIPKDKQNIQCPLPCSENDVNHKTKNIEALLLTRLGRKNTLGGELEAELVKYCQAVEGCICVIYGLTVHAVK